MPTCLSNHPDKPLPALQVWGPRPQFVVTSEEPLGVEMDADVVVCGGTLGIFLATSLQLRGGRAVWGGMDSRHAAELN